jgi:hypothetical protein
VGQTASNSGLGLAIDALGQDGQSVLFEAGRRYAMAWVQSLLQDPSSHTRLRAILIATGSAGLPEEILDNLQRLTRTDFLNAFAKFAGDRCIVVTGGSR